MKLVNWDEPLQNTNLGYITAEYHFKYLHVVKDQTEDFTTDKQQIHLQSRLQSVHVYNQRHLTL